MELVELTASVVVVALVFVVVVVVVVLVVFSQFVYQLMPSLVLVIC